MSKKMSKKIATIIATAISIATYAQQPTLLSDVVVTANKQEQKQSTTGKVITVINKDQLQKSDGKNLAQILSEQAGVFINGANQNLGSNLSVFTRGAATGRTLILIDGIPMNDPSQIVGDYDLNLINLNNIERIEICKGAQSTLYGSDAMAGVINIITQKKGIEKPIIANASYSYGSYNTQKAGLQLNGKLGKLIYSTKIATINSAGFSTATDKVGDKNFDVDGYSGNTFNTTLQLPFTNNLNLKAFINNSAYKTDLDGGAFEDAKNHFADNSNFTTGIGFHYNKNKLQVVANYVLGNFFRKDDDNASIANATNYALSIYKGNSTFLELYSNAQIAKNTTLLLGVDYRKGNMNSSYNSKSSWGNYDSYFKDTAMGQISFYASLRYNSNAFNVELGSRYNKHDRYGNNATFTFNPSVAIDKNSRIFASVASGFKTPTLYQLYDSYSGNKNLKPELSINYELGFAQNFSKFSQRLVGFYRENTSAIDYDYNQYAYYNFAAQKTLGVEFETTLQLNKQATLTANYTFLDNKENNQSRITSKDTTYNYSLRRPKHTTNLSFSYQITPSLYISIAGQYIASRFDIGGYQKPDVDMQNYFTCNAYAEYRYKSNTKLFINVQNITNTKIVEVTGYNSMPTFINVGISVGNIFAGKK
jgi:vitamin B12 transporter